eukprot:NODE_1970_length_1732_cov_350.685519_g1679_i0.p1 GENE.NODE_1970_length_1732_cov_350.685519_g1679_i0~~NODE_1970_length_1732_cov_350.685519_g1679_i0.p1  ORF type:complete len:496 (-),score=80.48 NODE_1970_length_1732_cov_350.685519_g1679_i0:188-1675(-)
MKFLLVLIPLVLSQFTLVFEDNFQSLSNWVPETMAGAATGNNEWQHYTDRSSNVFIGGSRFGNALHIVAKKENYNGHSYTSGRLHSARNFGPYGFYNVKAVVPKGNGVWPAIWLLPPGARTKYGGWAACGEIDIMETVCAANDGYSTLHFGGPWPKNVHSDFNNKWGFQVNWAEPHWYGVDWQSDRITFYVDATIVNGQITGGIKGPTVTSNQWYSLDGNGNRWPSPAPFDQQFMFILNVAIGGSWPCAVPGCCQNTPDSAEMLVFTALAYTGKNGQGAPISNPSQPGSYCSKGELSTNEGRGLAYPSNFQGYQSNDGGRGAGVTAEVCQQACDRVAECTAVSYSSQYQLCYLKAGSSCSSSKNANNFVTYWKTSSCQCNGGSPAQPPADSGCGKCCHSGAPYKCTGGPAANGCSANPWAINAACSGSCKCSSFLEESSGVNAIFEKNSYLAPVAMIVVCLSVIALIVAVIVRVRRNRISKVDAHEIPLTLLTDE